MTRRACEPNIGEYKPPASGASLFGGAKGRAVMKHVHSTTRSVCNGCVCALVLAHAAGSSSAAVLSHALARANWQDAVFLVDGIIEPMPTVISSRCNAQASWNDVTDAPGGQQVSPPVMDRSVPAAIGGATGTGTVSWLALTSETNVSGSSDTDWHGHGYAEASRAVRYWSLLPHFVSITFDFLLQLDLVAADTTDTVLGNASAWMRATDISDPQQPPVILDNIGRVELAFPETHGPLSLHPVLESAVTATVRLPAGVFILELCTHATSNATPSPGSIAVLLVGAAAAGSRRRR